MRNILAYDNGVSQVRESLTDNSFVYSVNVILDDETEGSRSIEIKCTDEKQSETLYNILREVTSVTERL